MTFKPNDSLTTQVADYLGQMIIQGELKPNERIQELRISTELGVSRGAIREALLILERHQLIQIFPRRGAIVAPLSIYNVRDFFHLWRGLLQQALTNLAKTWKNDDLATCFELEAKLSTCLKQEQHQEYYGNIIMFLKYLYSLCGNYYLEKILNDLLPLAQRCLYTTISESDNTLFQFQPYIQNIIKMIVARNQAEIDVLVTQFCLDYQAIVTNIIFKLEANNQKQTPTLSRGLGINTHHSI